VNEPGHGASSMTLTLPFENVNAGDNAETVRCTFTSVLLDYRGIPHAGNESLAISTIDVSPTETVVLNNVGDTGSCSHTLTRDAYRAFASTYLDVDLYDMEPDEKAYAVRMTVSVTTESGSRFEASRVKAICTPLIGLSTRSGAVRCEANRGSWVPDTGEEEEGGALYHLLRTQRDCSNLAVSSSLVNDGVCHPQNNVDGCWDGGDCCAYSCYAFNGGLVELKENGSYAFQHRCFEVDDATSCLDPALQNYVPPPDYSLPPQPVAFGGEGGALDDGQSLCIQLLEDFQDFLDAADCSASPSASCSAACTTTIRDAVCFTEAFARISLDCKAALTNATMPCGGEPRCPARTSQGCRCENVWTIEDATVVGSTCANPETVEYGLHANDWYVLGTFLLIVVETEGGRRGRGEGACFNSLFLPNGVLMWGGFCYLPLWHVHSCNLYLMERSAQTQCGPLLIPN
jgi:hypothetical protein